MMRKIQDMAAFDTDILIKTQKEQLDRFLPATNPENASRMGIERTGSFGNYKNY